MAEVAPDDDEIERFVVRRYAYDPARHERTHLVIAAFDNALEFEAAIDTACTQLQRRRESGEDVDPREHITGVVMEPGYHRRQQAGRIIRHAIKHGASLDAETWGRLSSDLPPGMAVSRSQLMEGSAGAERPADGSSVFQEP